MTLQDYRIKDSYDFMKGSSLLILRKHTSLVDKDIVVVHT